ncbi:hypothetical protein H8E06_00460 [bacterium]|nr:hypothetical protein [bacterium]
MDDKSPSKKPSKKALTEKAIRKNEKELKTLRKLLKNSHQPDAINHSIDVMQESLNSFVLLGYSFDGVPITAVSARTSQEYDALYSRAVQFVQQANSGSGSNNRSSSPGQDDEDE